MANRQPYQTAWGARLPTSHSATQSPGVAVAQFFHFAQAGNIYALKMAGDNSGSVANNMFMLLGTNGTLLIDAVCLYNKSARPVGGMGWTTVYLKRRWPVLAGQTYCVTLFGTIGWSYWFEPGLLAAAPFGAQSVTMPQDGGTTALRTNGVGTTANQLRCATRLGTMAVGLDVVFLPS